MNNCTPYNQDIALVRYNEIVNNTQSNGFKCTKVPGMYSYSCDVNGKLLAIELHKDKKICKEIPSKTVKQIKFLTK